MGQTAIREMKPTHDSVLDKVLANPHMTLKELSNVTGYSVAWLSQMMRSDLFRAAYDARRGDFECEVMMGIGERLNALSHLAIDKLTENLQSTIDPDFIVDAFDKVLHRTGYAPNAAKQATGPIQQQNNVFLVGKEELGELRSRVLQGTVLPVPALPHDPTPDT